MRGLKISGLQHNAALHNSSFFRCSSVRGAGNSSKNEPTPYATLVCVLQKQKT